MLAIDLIDSGEQAELKFLQERCGQFFIDSQKLPLFKNLSNKYNDFHRVKVRKRKSEVEEEFVDTFNSAFAEKQNNIRQRAIFANGVSSFAPCYQHDLEPFFIFPIDGYRYMYSTEVENSNADYKKVFDLLFETFGDGGGRDIATELLKFTYKSDDLYRGIQSGAEIILYNIPYFYAIKVSAVNDYSQLVKSILPDK
ncbi:MAG: hypothetical protein ACREAU_00260 [Nitrosopumilaceae archaeon]